MSLVIPDRTLQSAGLNEREMKLEIACRLFDAGKLELWPAAQLAGPSRGEFEEELALRKIAIWRPTREDWEAGKRTIGELEEKP
jgi:predicted HTH domain antitoxin